MALDGLVVGLILIVSGALVLVVGGAGWAGLLRHEALRDRPGRAQQTFAASFLGGPAAILLGMFELRAFAQGGLRSTRRSWRSPLPA